MSGYGIEARHSWDGGAIVLGDLTSFPRYRITAIGGNRVLGDFDAPAEPATGRRGEIPRKGSRGGKTVPYSITIEALNLAQLRTAEEALLAAFDPTDEREMVITPHPDYATGSRTFSARCVSLLIPDEQVAPPTARTFGYERDAVISLRASDPRVFDTVVNTLTTGTGANAATNRATNPKAGASATTGWVTVGAPIFAPVSLSTLTGLTGLPKGVTTGFLFGGDALNDYAYLPISVTNGSTYTFSVYLEATKLTGGAGLHMRAIGTDGLTVLGASTPVLAVGGWQRLTVSFTATATGSAWLQIRQTAAGTADCYFTAVQAEANAIATDYHDGSMPISSWAGTAHNSNSTRRARRDVVVTNAGLIDTDPTFTIRGDAIDPALRHRESGAVLSFQGLTLSAGQFLTVDFRRRRIRLNGVLPGARYLDRAGSDWWDESAVGLKPGANTIELYRTGAGDADVAWRNAYPA